MTARASSYKYGNEQVCLYRSHVQIKSPAKYNLVSIGDEVSSLGSDYGAGSREIIDPVSSIQSVTPVFFLNRPIKHTCQHIFPYVSCSTNSLNKFNQKQNLFNELSITLLWGIGFYQIHTNNSISSSNSVYCDFSIPYKYVWDCLPTKCVNIRYHIQK